jgi:hypothetical protein
MIFLKTPKEESNVVTCEDLGGQGIGPPYPTFLQAITHSETILHPNENGVVPYPATRVNDQVSPPSVGTTVCPGSSY